MTEQHVPEWACGNWGNYEHDWLDCYECLRAYEEWMARRVDAGQLSPSGGEQTTVRRCIELEARSWARVVLGHSKRFIPFVARG